MMLSFFDLRWLLIWIFKEFLQFCHVKSDLLLLIEKLWRERLLWILGLSGPLYNDSADGSKLLELSSIATDGFHIILKASLLTRKSGPSQRRECSFWRSFCNPLNLFLCLDYLLVQLLGYAKKFLIFFLNFLNIGGELLCIGNSQVIKYILDTFLMSNFGCVMLKFNHFFPGSLFFLLKITGAALMGQNRLVSYALTIAYMAGIFKGCSKQWGSSFLSYFCI